ncbi:MAG TPA: hypothetical protein VHZ03_06045 [Trebonia sp.]|nr:hypothetical protein [Trebonia sp.]
MEEVEDEPLFCDRVAGTDIGKAAVMVTIRVPSETRKGGRQQETREFGTTRRELLALADWLRAWQVEKAGMESTSGGGAEGHGLAFLDHGDEGVLGAGGGFGGPGGGRIRRLSVLPGHCGPPAWRSRRRPG